MKRFGLLFLLFVFFAAESRAPRKKWKPAPLTVASRGER